MPNIKKTKGQSEITSVILLAVIAILLVSLLYSPLKKIIESPLLSPELCQDIKKEQPLSMNNSCYNPSTRSLDVSIKKNNEESLESITFKLDFDNETLSWQCGQTCAGCKTPSQEGKTYHLFPNRIPKTITIVVDNCDLITSEVILC